MSTKMRQMGSMCALVTPLSEEPEGRHDMALLMWDAAYHIRRIAKDILYQLGPADIPMDLPDPAGDTAFGLFLFICRKATVGPMPKSEDMRGVIQATRMVEILLEPELSTATMPSSDYPSQPDAALTARTSEGSDTEDWEELALPAAWDDAETLTVREQLEHEVLNRLSDTEIKDESMVVTLQARLSRVCGQLGDAPAACQFLEESLRTIRSCPGGVMLGSLANLCGRLEASDTTRHLHRPLGLGPGLQVDEENPPREDRRQALHGCADDWQASGALCKQEDVSSSLVTMGVTTC